MKRVLILCLLLMLTGCWGTVPVKQNFPDADPEMMQKCGPLSTIDQPEVKLSELLSTVVKNYKKYHNCADLVDAWQEWYTKQKKISQDVNN